jgi:hypothetical protein
LIITVAKTIPTHANIEQIPMNRDWMEITGERHAYHCFPVSIANRLGWSVSFPEDIIFEWDGGVDLNAERVKIIKGHKYAHVNRANHTISFETGLRFIAEENVSLMTMPVPNQFIRGAQCFTTIVSTSVLPGSLPIAWMVTEPNLQITIPANTPIAAIVPVSLTDIQSHELVISNKDLRSDFDGYMKARGDAAEARNSKGDWSHFYRDAVDHLGNPFGKHETKKIVMKITEEK